MLTQVDLEEIGKLMDKKLKPILEIVDLTKKGVLNLLEEGEDNFKLKFHERI